MSFVPKTWQDFPNTSTPLSAVALVDLETRLSGYTDSVAASGATVGLPGSIVRRNSQIALRDFESVMDWGVVGDGVTDDRAAIQAAIDDLGANGGGGLWFPSKSFLVGAHPTSTSICLYVRHDNIRFKGAGWGATKLINGGGGAQSLFMPAGWAKGSVADLNNQATKGWLAATVYNLTGSYAKGVTSITLATPAQAGNFTVGDYILIRTGQTLASSVSQPDAEVNIVKSANASTGVITLYEPTTKPYAQEYFISGTTGVTSTSVTANPAVYGVAKLTDRILEGPQFEDMQLVQTQATTLFAGGEMTGFRATRVRTVTAYQAFGFGSHRDTAISDCQCRMENAPAPPVYLLASDSMSSHARFEDNLLVSDGALQIHVHEGSAQVIVKRNVCVSANTPGVGSVVDIGARAYDIEVEDNTIVNGTNDAAISVDSTCVGGGSIRRNKIMGGPFADAVAINCPGWQVDDNDTHGLDVTFYAGASVPQTPLGMQTLSGWLSPAQQTITLGNLPKYCFVTGVRLYVSQAFNGSVSNNISVGFGAFGNVFAPNTDVSTTGLKTPAAGSNLGWQSDLVRTANATYTPGGTQPTTGHALVVVEFYIVPREITP